MSEDQASSSISSSPEPPEPMDLEDMQETGADGLEEAVREAVEGQTKEEGLDLRQVAREFAEYLVVDSKQDKQVLDDRIEGVVFRVEEFKSQLEHVQHNMVCNSEKVDDLHSYAQHLKDLYTRVDQVGAFVQLVTQHVDTLEEVVAKAERDLEPSKLRRVLSGSFKFGRNRTSMSTRTKTDPSAKWQPPKLFKAGEYFATR